MQILARSLLQVKTNYHYQLKLVTNFLCKYSHEQHNKISLTHLRWMKIMNYQHETQLM